MADTLEFDITTVAKNARTNAFLDSVTGKEDEDVKVRTIYTIWTALNEVGDVAIVPGVFNMSLIEDRLTSLAETIKDKLKVKDK